MSAKIVRYSDAKYVAYDAVNGDEEFFESFDEAKAWLVDSCDEGIGEETEQGYSFIARITHHTAMEIIDRKENYHQHTDDCPDDCNEEEWPYDSDYDYAGRVYMVPHCGYKDDTDLIVAAREMADAVALLPCDDGRILGLLPVLCRLRAAIMEANK